MLVGSAIPNLVNGVSQQPATQRLSSQGEIQENGMSSIVEGLSKRAPTSSLAKLLNTTGIEDAFVHVINRDVNERYVVVILNGTIKVFDLDGNEKAVSIQLAGNDDYIETDTPSLDLRAVTVADYTFIVNTKKKVKMTRLANALDITVNEAHANSVITVEIDFVRASYTVQSGDTEAAVASGIVNALVSAATTLGVQGDYSIQVASNTAPNNQVVSIGRTDLSGFSYDVDSDSTQLGDLTITKDRWSDSEKALIFVKQGNYGTQYSVTVALEGGTSFSATKNTSNTDVTDIQTTKIASDLYNTLVNTNTFSDHFSATLSGSLILLTKIDNAHGDWSLRTSDSNGNRNLIGIKDQIQKFTDLPATCFDGFTVKVIGDAADESDDYYVKFESGSANNVAAEGVWKETVGPLQDNGFTNITMPHFLIRQADGTFVFKASGIGINWEQREAGDVDSNPEPSFVGRAINDVVFFRNRLQFLSDENVIMSAAGDYFRFWRKTVTALLDDDPIDVSASNESVSILRHAVPFQKKEVLFSDQKQFVLEAGDLLTPKTVSIKPTTVFESSVRCKPVVSGNQIYFATPRGENAAFSGVREYIVDQNTQNDDAADVTAHVPAYVPANATKMFAALNDSVLGVLTANERNAIYVYKFYWSGQEKLQSSWSKWTFPEGVKVLGGAFIASTLYLVMERQDGVYLEVLGVEPRKVDEGLDFMVHLDRKITDDDCSVSYDPDTNLTTWTLPYAESNDMAVVVRADTGTRKVGQEVSVSHPTNTTLAAQGDWSGVPVIIGVKYRFKYRFSQFSVKEKNQNTGAEKTLTGERLQIGRVKLLVNETGYFEAHVAVKDGQSYVYKYNPRVLGTSDATIGALKLGSGEFTFPVRTKSDRVTIDIISDSWLPLHIQSAEWEGQFYARSQRV